MSYTEWTKKPDNFKSLQPMFMWWRRQAMSTSKYLVHFPE